MSKIRQFLRIQWLVIILLTALAYAPAWAGGWAVVTLEELPAQVIAGQPFTVQFSVRQHGQSLLPGLSPTVTAERADTGERVKAPATETRQPGFYQASITLPASGQWHWEIDAFAAAHTMPPLTVTASPAAITPSAAATAPMQDATALSWVVGIAALIAASGLALVWRRQQRRIWLVGAAAALLLCLGAFAWQWSPPSALLAQAETKIPLGAEEISAAIAPEQMGEALFVAKGCIQCHRNDNVAMAANNNDFGPNLTNYQGAPDYLRLWLKDPASVKPQTQMPDLGLSEAEIETLIAFVTASH